MVNWVKLLKEHFDPEALLCGTGIGLLSAPVFGVAFGVQFLADTWQYYVGVSVGIFFSYFFRRWLDE